MLFYWLSWIFWVVVTFFMKSTAIRTGLSIWILLIISASTLYLPIGEGSISISLFILMIGSMALYSRMKRIYYSLFASFTITIAYAAILIWEKITPIWIIVPRELFISIFIVFILTITTKQIIQQLLIGLLGICFGEVLYFVMLLSYHIQIETGGLEFLDQVAVMVLLLFLISLIQTTRKKIMHMFLYTQHSIK